jgi:hypothetical protein
MAIAEMATSKAGRVLMVAVVSHNLRRGKIFDSDDALSGISYVLARSEHRVLLLKRVRTDSIEAIVWPVYSDLRIPATVSGYVAIYLSKRRCPQDIAPLDTFQGCRTGKSLFPIPSL